MSDVAAACPACGDTKQVWDDVDKAYYPCTRCCGTQNDPLDLYPGCLHSEALSIYSALLQGLAANPYHRPEAITRDVRFNLMTECLYDAVTMRKLVTRHEEERKAKPPG